MSTRLSLLCLLLVTVHTWPTDPVTSKDDNDRLLLLQQANPIAAFDDWMTQFNRTYIKGSEEWRQRYEIWVANLHRVIDYNRNQRSHWLTMTGLADMEPDELRGQFLGLTAQERPTRVESDFNSSIDVSVLPKRVDWRERGAVTSVRDQRQCGACWAFSAVGSVEGLNAISTGSLISLSEQQLIDCDTYDKGCDGGFMSSAFSWIAVNGGITTLEDYGYDEDNSTCDASKNDHHVVSIAGFDEVPMTEGHLIRALSQQPISVAVKGSQLSFSLYGGGVYDAECGVDVDHAVLAVGYDLDDGYIIVKNSWGEYWGEAGYIRLALNKNNGTGQCGVASLASYPVPLTPVAPVKPEEDIQCGFRSYCRAGQTCCCLNRFLDVCFEWGCCSEKTAVCCSEGQYCCSEDYPVCGPQLGLCRNHNASLPAMKMSLSLSRSIPIRSRKFAPVI